MAGTLFYFKGRGRADPIRFVLVAAGVTFSDVFLETKEEFEKIKQEGLCMFGQVPVLVLNGAPLAQSDAIIRHVARLHNLYPSSESDMLKIDMACAGISDWRNSVISSAFSPNPQEIRQSFMDKRANRYLEAFESQILGPFFFGETLTVADVLLLEASEFIKDEVEHIEVNFDAVVASYPKVRACVDAVKAIPALSDYLRSDRRMPRADEAYVSTVRRVLY